LFNISQITFNSNVNLIFNIWPLLYDRNATATDISQNMGTSKHVNIELLF